MLRYGWFQPKQTNKQTINHRYTIYGIEKKTIPTKQWDFFHGFFSAGFHVFFFYGIQNQLQNGGFKWHFTTNNRDLILGLHGI
jgi:hypothetical protein